MERMIIAQCIRSHTKLPSKIQNAPSLLMGLDFYFTAFEDLEHERTSGFTEGRIMLQSIMSYCNNLELDSDQTSEMIFHIRKMDDVYLSHKGSKSGKA